MKETQSGESATFSSGHRRHFEFTEYAIARIKAHKNRKFERKQLPEFRAKFDRHYHQRYTIDKYRQ
jgi:hypothetical protein